MKKLIQIGGTGFLISFLGALPLGTLNVTTFQIAAVKEVSSALWFALAVVLVELIEVRLTLDWKGAIHLEHRLFYYVLPTASAVLLYLAHDTLTGLGYVIGPKEGPYRLQYLVPPSSLGCCSVQ